MIEFFGINNDAFIFTLEKLISIPIVILFFFSLKGIGFLITSNEKFKITSPILGTGFIYLLVLFYSILMPGKNINLFLCSLIIIGFISYIFKNNKLDFINDFSKIVILSPFLFFAAFTREYSWDDYTHWLWFLDYLYVNNHLPIAQEPYLEQHPRYVYGLSILRYIPNIFLSELNINISGLLNVMFLFLVFDWHKILFISKFKSKTLFEFIFENSLILPLIFFILLCHNTRVIMNANADFILVIFFVSSTFVLIKESILSENITFKNYLFIFLMLVALISVKQVSTILIGIIYLSIISSIIIQTLFLNYKLINFFKKFIIHITILVGLFFVYQLWEYYTVLQKFESHTFSMNIPSINLDGLLFVLTSISKQLIHRPYSFFAFLLLCYVAFFRKIENPEISLLIKTAIFINMGLTLFLILIYISIWDGYGALSFHRYLMPAGVLSFSIIYSIYHDQITKQITRIKLFKISFSLFTISSILIILNAQKFVRPILTDVKKIENFILSNYNDFERIIIIDEKNWGFGSIVLKFNLRNKVDIDVGSNVDNLSGKAYGFFKKSQISKMLEKYDKIFILPKNQKYDLQRHKDLKRQFRIAYPDAYNFQNKDNIFLLTKSN